MYRQTVHFHCLPQHFTGAQVELSRTTFVAMAIKELPQQTAEAATAEKPTPEEVAVDLAKAASADTALQAFMSEEQPEEPTETVPKEKEVMEIETQKDETNKVEAPAMAAGDAKQQQLAVAETEKPVVPTGPDAIWDQVNAAMLAPTCKKCGQVCNLERVVNKNKGEPKNNVICKGCNAATTMLSRHLGCWPVPAFSGLSPDQQLRFWKSCNEIIQRQGKLDYGSIKATLSITLQERQIELAKAEFKSKFLPLSVWVQKGFAEEAVLRGEHETHPILGDTYALNLKTISKEFVREKVEAMLTTFEGQARKRKVSQISSGASKDKPLEDASKDEKDDELLNLTWIPSESPSKKKAPGPAEEDDEDEPASKKRMTEAQLRKHNFGVKKLAQKGVTVLLELQVALANQLANISLLPQKLGDDLKHVGNELAKGLEICREGLKEPEAGEALQDLPFDAKSLAQKAKDAKKLFAQCGKMVKLYSKAVGSK